MDDLTDEIATRNNNKLSTANNEEDPFCDYSTLLASVLDQSITMKDYFINNTGPLHRWYSTLSFKLDCIRTAVFLLFSLSAALRHGLNK